MKYFAATALVISSLGLAAAAQAQVQVSIGPKLGENLANRHVGGGSNTDYRFGLVAGAQATVSWKKFAVQPALLFSQKGSSSSLDIYYSTGTSNVLQAGVYTTRFRLNYLTLPLNFTFAPAGTGTGPQFFAGPYLGVLLGGSISRSITGQEDSSDPIYVATDVDPSSGQFAARRFDAGVQAGVGLRVEHLVLLAEYSLGLRTYAPNYLNTSLPSSDYYNRAFQASVSYLFDLTH